MIIGNVKDHGFIAPTIEADHYVFGSNKILGSVLQENGQWDDFLPEEEVQNVNGLEVYNCTAFGTTSIVEMILKRLGKGQNNYSDRYVGTMAETRPPGNSPHTVAECIRTISGLVDEKLLPFSEDINDVDTYFSLGNDGENLKAIGWEWLKTHDFKHEWVFTTQMTAKERIEQLKEALKYSPIGVSVRAWVQDDDGLYIKNEGEGDTHWTVLYGYEEGKYWKVFDSYSDHGTVKKKLAWNYAYTFTKKYHVALKPIIKKRWWEVILEILSKIFK